MSRSKDNLAAPAFTSDRLNDLIIKDHVPIILDLDSPSYNAWRTYFGLLIRSYRLVKHVDGSVDIRDMKYDDEWLAVDACIVKWILRTVSRGIFDMVNTRDPSTHAIWTRVCDLFLYNQLQRHVFLQGEFFTLQQNDVSIDDYCTRLKVLADELRDVGMTIDDSVLLTDLLRGLHPDLGQSAANLSLITPTYAKAVTYLRMKEKRLRHSTWQATHMALHAGHTSGSGAAPPALWALALVPPPAPAPTAGRN
ncbi:uncharacterized protein [Aegilops tauschii subsp. strangulata]|uniref:uncharacterized protein n=1 Tax=Aegilops tauschii subsp. strangulata TaxID=200361 RepID=UPI00098A3AAC|nr:uncharacterized protein LOC109756029 [Aegilops tauschii subsp. strangulata]